MPPELAYSDFRTPEWVKHAVFYQIFPERFANGNTANDPENVQPWGTTPTPKNYMGGDLHGIISRLDYLQDLGITALYLNPIFHALSNHKYDTYDYFRIDPHLGDMATFRELIDQAHQRGMRVILDGVFNHCGRGFFAFVNVLENGGESPYRNWFYIEDLPLHPYNDKKPANYAGWWSLRSLPKLNVGHPPTRRYILDVARYWLEQGADGWRLDVPNEIDDTAFWREFRQVVKQANPDAYIVGEIWEDATRWLDGTQFDAVMNYIWRDLCRDFFAHDILKPSAFAQGLDMLQQRYPDEAMLAQLNLFGSHDTARFRTEAHGDVERMFVATLFQMTFPGAPCIYYGDEIGMQGGKDPLCRGCFPWEESALQHPLRAWVKQCIAVRHAWPALRTGHYSNLLAQDTPPLFAFVRWNDEQQLIVALNPANKAVSVELPLQNLPHPAAARLRDCLSDDVYPVEEGYISLSIAPWRGVVLVSDA